MKEGLQLVGKGIVAADLLQDDIVDFRLRELAMVEVAEGIKTGNKLL